jgi:DNA-binding NarL/FixJ family response regulator
MWNAGTSRKVIAAHFGAGSSWVSENAKRLGLARRIIDSTRMPGRLIETAYVQERMSLDAIVARLRTGMPTISRGTVKRLLVRRGVTLRKANERDPELTTRCVRMRRAGMEYPEIARSLNLTVGQVGERCRSVLGAGRRGKFSRVDVAKLVELRKRGKTIREIAEIVGLRSSATVCYHLRRARRSA